MKPIVPDLGDPNSGAFAGVGRFALALLKKTWFRIGLVGFVGLLVFTKACFTYVPPGFVGIRQVYYGSEQGIQSEAEGPGTYFTLAGIERYHMFPVSMQVVNFSDSTSEASQASRHVAGVKVQTSDGYNVLLDVSVLYHIEDAYIVFKEAGPGRAFEDRLVVPRADRILRKTLGELNAEEFYAGPRRIEKSRNAHDQLVTELAPFGIVVDALLVRRYTYDDKYQQLIEGRKIADQTVFLRKAEAKAAIEERKRDTIVAEVNANARTELSRGAAEVRKLESQAELYRRTQAAGGKLLVDLAEAKGTQLENTALQGAGSENMVGLKMAEVLAGVKVIVLTSDGANGMNPLDLGSVLRMFEVK